MKYAFRWISAFLMLMLCISSVPVLSYGAGVPEISYEFSTLLPGRADGTVTLKTDGYSGENYALHWGTSDGILQGYEPLTDVSDMTISKDVLRFTPAALTVIPPQATHLWVTLDGTVLTSYEIPAERRLSEAEPNYTFGVISDLHFGSSNAEAAFAAAMDAFAAKDVSFVLSVGDNTCDGSVSQWRNFANAYEFYSEIPLWFVLGNHDALAWNLGVSPAESMKNAKEYFPNYVKEAHSFGEEFKVSVSSNHPQYDYSMTYQGNLYLFLGIGAASNDSEDKNIDQKLSNGQLEWLEENLSEYYGQADPGKVFLIFHYYTLESGMHVREGTEWDKASSKQLHTLLNKYPGVISFSGHTHYSFDADMNSYAGSYAALHVPSLAYGGLSREGEGQTDGYEGYLVEVYDGYTLVKGMDYLTGDFVSCASFVLDRNFADAVTIYGMSLRTTASGAIQWRAKSGESSWTKLTSLSDLKTDGTVQSIPYSNGKTVDFRASETHVQWKLSSADDSEWENLIPLEDIPKDGPSSDLPASAPGSAVDPGDTSGGGAMIWFTVVLTAVILCAGAVATVLILRKNKK